MNLIILLLPHVGCVFAGSHLMDALVTGGSHLNFGFVQFVPNLNLKVGPRRRNTLVWLSSCLTLLVIIVALHVRRVDRHLIYSHPKRLICRHQYRFMFIFRRAQSHRQLDIAHVLKGLFRRRQVLLLLHLANRLLIGIHYVVGRIGLIVGCKRWRCVGTCVIIVHVNLDHRCVPIRFLNFRLSIYLIHILHVFLGFSSIVKACPKICARQEA